MNNQSISLLILANLNDLYKILKVHVVDNKSKNPASSGIERQIEKKNKADKKILFLMNLIKLMKTKKIKGIESNPPALKQSKIIL